MKVLVTGAGGQLGIEVIHELELRAAALVRGKPLEVIAATREALDVSSRDAVLATIVTIQPDVVIHCAAFTAVDLCETECDRAFAVNALGTRHIAEACSLVDAHLTYVSTDYVFDGSKQDPYTEWDLPNPLSIYGRSKLGGERALSPGSTIVRTSWVCGPHGNNMVKTVLRLVASGSQPLRFVDDQHGCPTIAGDLATTLVTLALERRPGIFHVTNQGPTTWFEFVREIVGLAGADRSLVEPISTKDLDPPRPAPRPANSVLDNAALRLCGLDLLRPWQEATAELVAAAVVGRGSDVSSAAGEDRSEPAAPSELEKVSAIVVNRDAGDSLFACVASLRAAGVHEIVVVDNASSDGSLARLSERDREVILVPTGRNLGYGRGVNAGAKRATGDLFLACNPDLVVDSAAVRQLISCLRDASDVAVVGPTILEPDGARYPSVRNFPSLSDAAGHAVIGLVHPDNPYTRRYRRAGDTFDAASDVDWVSGACMAIRRVAFDSVGGFDPSYFMYVEDLDICWRLHQAGWRVVHLPEAEVTHLGGVSSRRHPYRMLAAHHRSTLRFFSRSTTGPQRLLIPVVAAALGVRLVASWGLEARKSLVGETILRRGRVE